MWLNPQLVQSRKFEPVLAFLTNPDCEFGRTFRAGLLAALMLTLISSCSWFRDSDDCPEGGCDPTNIVNNTGAARSWYCYGNEEDRSWECEEKPQPGKKPKPASTSDANVKQMPQPMLPPEPVVVPEPEPKPETVLAALTAVSSDKSALILQQPADFFAVQLIAMQGREQVLTFASNQGIDEPLLTRISSQGTDWYVLLLGIYPDRASALSAREAWLQGRTLTMQPWIRNLAPLQEAIKLAAQ